MHRQPIQQQLVVNRRIICPHIRLEDEVMVRETQPQRLHDHGISGRPQVHFRREPSGVYRQLTPLRTGMQQRDA